MRRIVPDLPEGVVVQQKLLTPRAGALDIDRRIDAPFGQFAVEMQLHVASALELLVDHIVHAAAGIDQAGADDGQAATALDVAGGAEEPLGRIQGDRIHAAGQRAPAGRHGQVVGARQAGDGVEQDGDIAASLDQALGPLQRHLGHLGVIFDRLIERRRDDLPFNRAAHVGHLFRPLADQTDHEVHIRVVGGDAVGDRLQEHGLAGFRRRDDQPALTPSDRRDEVQQARRQNIGRRLEINEFKREDRRQSVERRTLPGYVGVFPIDGFDPEQAVELLVILRRPHLPADPVAGTQPEAANLRLGNVDVIRTGQKPLATQEAEAVLDDVEDAVTKDAAFQLSLCPEDPELQFRTLHAARIGDLHLSRLRHQFFIGLGFEVGDGNLGRRRLPTG